MADQSITCPNCGKKIPLSKALTGQIEERLTRDFEARMKEQEKSLAEDFEQRLSAERSKLEKQARKKVQDELATELQDLREQLKERDEQIDQARKEELKLRKRKRELEQKEQDLQLEMTRKLDEERQKIERAMTKKLDEEHRLKDLEKDKQLAEMRSQIEELKRKAEQGSQQLQGEVAELELENILAAAFRCDQVGPVPKGVRGADVLQKVFTSAGQYCGTIIWESKNTKTWSDTWLAKLKDDQRALKAELAVLASVALPKEITHFANREGVWVTDLPCALGLAAALRANLIEIASARSATVGKNEKMEVMYNYLAGPEFRQRVEAIVESFVCMKEDLEQERRATERMWSRREKQIQRVVTGVSGMYGDMQGIFGAALPKIERLELPPGGDAIPHEET